MKNLLILMFVSLIMATNINAQRKVKFVHLDKKNTPVCFELEDNFLGNKDLKLVKDTLEKTKKIIKDLYKLNKKTSLVKKKENYSYGIKHEKFQQYHNGYKVLHAIYSTHTKNGNLKSITGIGTGEINIIDTSVMNPKKIEKIALDYIFKHDSITDTIVRSKLRSNFKSELVLCKNYIGKSDIYHLAYQIDLNYKKYYCFDANSGELLGEFKNIYSGIGESRHNGTVSFNTEYVESEEGYQLIDRTRNIFTTYDNDFITDNDDIWNEYDNSHKQNALLDIHWGLSKSWDYFNDKFGYEGRNGVNDDMIAIFPGNLERNASYIGGIFRFGEGSGLYNTYTELSIVAHEYGHMVCEDLYDFAYVSYTESAAIDEGMADIWSICIQHYVNPNGEDELYQIGHKVLPPGNLPLRYLLNPLWLDDPKTYKGDYWLDCFVDDDSSWEYYCLNESAHNNGTVLGYWFFLLTYDYEPDENYIGLENAEEIVFNAAKNYFVPEMNYHLASIYTIMAAKDKNNGNCSASEVQKIIGAWEEVGVITDNVVNVTGHIDGHEVYSAKSIINANCEIQSNSVIEFIAGNEVNLNPGFIFPGGSVSEFVISIEEYCP